MVNPINMSNQFLTGHGIKVYKQFNGSKIIFQQMVLEQMDIHTPKKQGNKTKNINLNLTSYTNIKSKTIKF